MKIVITPSNYNHADYSGERYTLPSMTVQGAVLPLAKLLTTYTIVPPDAADYYDDEQLAAYAKHDEFEREELYRELTSSLRSSRVQASASHTDDAAAPDAGAPEQ